MRVNSECENQSRFPGWWRKKKEEKRTSARTFLFQRRETPPVLQFQHSAQPFLLKSNVVYGLKQFST
jgi:hypothetical protein